MEKIKRIKNLIFFVFAIILFIISPATARAASLYFSPSAGSYEVGKTFSVNVYISSADQAINAVSGAISFPQNKLEVVSLSKNSSIIAFWVVGPSFSNSAGAVNFEGITLNPGFTGVAGEIIKVNFKVKAAGFAPLVFSSGSVLANDGQGTNILTGLGNASFSLGNAGPAAPKAITPSEIINAPIAPEISSPTHSDPNKWYAQKEAKFNWLLSSEITGARLLVGRIPNAIPIVTYIPAISSKKLNSFSDGIWYFSVRLLNDAGWGAISRFRFQIDTKKPENFKITEIKRNDLTNPKAKFIFDADDKTSGIDHYKIQIDDGPIQTWRNENSGIFETPALNFGRHTLIAKAVDKAGNSLANSAEFITKALLPPTITSYPKEIQSDGILIVKGITYSNAKVIFWLQKGKEKAKSQVIKSDNNGSFTFIAENKLKEGVYALRAEVIDKRGAKSVPSEKIIIVARQAGFLKIGSQAVNLLAIIVPLIALIILLLFLIWYSWHKFSSFRKRARKETKEAEQMLHKEIKMLKNNIKDQIKLLEKTKSKRELTREENKIIKQMKSDLDSAEKLIRREIKDIEKEIE